MTCLRHGRIFKDELAANLLPSPSVKKKFENRLIFGRVIGKSLMSCFFDSQCNFCFTTPCVQFCN